MIKTVESREELFIQFTDQDIQDLGWEKGQKLSWEISENGEVKIVPYAKFEIDLADFSREELEDLIKNSCERDISVNEVIEEILKDFVQDKSIKVKPLENLEHIDSLRKAYNLLLESGRLFALYVRASGCFEDDYQTFLEYLERVKNEYGSDDRCESFFQWLKFD